MTSAGRRLRRDLARQAAETKRDVVKEIMDHLDTIDERLGLLQNTVHTAQGWLRNMQGEVDNLNKVVGQLQQATDRQTEGGVVLPRGVEV